MGRFGHGDEAFHFAEHACFQRTALVLGHARAYSATTLVNQPQRRDPHVARSASPIPSVRGFAERVEDTTQVAFVSCFGYRYFARGCRSVGTSGPACDDGGRNESIG